MSSVSFARSHAQVASVGFDEFFAHEQVIEVDAPGLTSPVLTNFDWKHLPRPVIPLDEDVR